MALDRTFTATESELCASAAKGEVLRLLGRDPEDRKIGPDLVHDLCVDRDDVHSKGVRIVGGIITGPLDFAFATLKVPLVLEDCTIGGPGGDGGEEAQVAVRLDSANGSWISFERCRIDGQLSATQLRTTYSLDLTGADVGTVLLDGAAIGGQLLMIGTKVTGNISATAATVTSNADLRGAQLTEVAGHDPGEAGTLTAAGLKVGGNLDLGQLLGEDGRAEPVHASGDVILTAAKVDRELRLTAADITGAVVLDDATVTSNLQASGVHIGGRVERGGLSGRRLTVGGAAMLDRDRKAKGRRFHSGHGVNLNDASIGHDLSLVEADITGAILLMDSTVGSNLALKGAHLADRPAAEGTHDDGDHGDLAARGISVGRSLDLSASGDRVFTTAGYVDLYGADIAGFADFNDAVIGKSGRDVKAVSIRLRNATVGLDLLMRGATLLAKDEQRGVSLDAAPVKVGGGVVMRRSDRDRGAGKVFVSRGSIDLRFASIGTDLNMEEAEIGDAVEEAVIGVADRHPGVVRLSDATITSNLNLHAVTINGWDRHDLMRREEGDDSLLADRIDVGGDLTFEGRAREPFRSVGAVVLRGAKIGGRLDLRHTTASGPQHHERGRWAIWSAVGVRWLLDVLRILHLRNPKPKDAPAGAGPSMTRLDLRESQCWRFTEPGPHCPKEGEARLQGFQFETMIIDGDVDVSTRLDWVRLQGFGKRWSPDPYEQLAAFYRRHGDELAARKVTIAKHRDELTHLRQTAHGHSAGQRLRSLWYRFWRTLFGLVLGFGYRRWTAGAFVIVLILLAGLSFSRFDDRGAMVSTSGLAAKHVPCGAAYTCFNPLVYGADIVLPIIDLGQDSAWQPNPKASGGHVAELERVLFVVFGWAMTTLFVAAFTSLIKRD